MPKHLTLACLGALKLYELENFRVSGSLPQFIFEVCSALYRSPSLHTWLQLIKEKNTEQRSEMFISSCWPRSGKPSQFQCRPGTSV